MARRLKSWDEEIEDLQFELHDVFAEVMQDLEKKRTGLESTALPEPHGTIMKIQWAVLEECKAFVELKHRKYKTPPDFVARERDRLVGFLKQNMVLFRKLAERA